MAGRQRNPKDDHRTEENRKRRDLNLTDIQIKKASPLGCLLFLSGNYTKRIKISTPGLK